MGLINAMLVTILLLITLAVAVWFWQDSMKAKEVASKAGRDYCKEKQLQLLDGTVAVHSWRLKFDKKMVIMRMFRMSVYQQAEDRRFVVPIYMRNHEVIAIGHDDKKVIRLSDYRA
ncbi:MAG: hypothetical protein COV52_04980 [Gammaproteobacteria bacterium CG11_big_fil_rev_8_21_14_0_20_46_22]|nr:MAG: hypothetical protein COW05_04745 [Gammaproteobacteria bacterium CG12_big_fil_rev_8_21_14_0_65_46_12]PIR11217.1 MAG: hypothetical protein COV52_04980 [Gammaproteobacteria bacterium CG11_big_fil_rev_8_21_14_0_20_46_22]